MSDVKIRLALEGGEVVAAGIDNVKNKMKETGKAGGEAANGLKEGSKQLDQVGVSAKQTAAAMRMVPAQITDIVVGLQSGQKPITVLLQQGGQLKDMFGGIGPAARALGTYVASMINPFTVAAAAAAGLGAAYYAATRDAAAFNEVLILSGNPMGANIAQLGEMAAEMSKMAGVTQGAASEALRQVMGAGGVATSALQAVTTAALDLERVGGPAVAQTAAQFAALGKDPVGASLKLNETTNWLTESVFKQITALEAQGRSADAAKLAQTAYADAMNERIPQLAANLGTLEGKWATLKAMASDAWDSMLNIGREDTPKQKLQKAFDDLAEVEEAARNKPYSAMRTEHIKALAETVRSIQAEIGAQDALNKKDEIAGQKKQYLIDLAKQEFDQLSKSKKMALELKGLKEDAARLGLDPAEVARKEAVIVEKYKEKKAATVDYVSALQGQLDAEKQRGAYLAKYGLGFEALTAGEKKALEIERQLATATDAHVKAKLKAQLVIAQELGQTELLNNKLAEKLKQDDALKKSYEETAVKTEAAAKAAQFELETYGLTESAINNLIASKKEDEAATLEQAQAGKDLDPVIQKQIESLKREAAAYRSVANAKRGLEDVGNTEKQNQEIADQAKKAADEWKKTVDRIQDTFHDGFVAMLTQGKDGWKSFTASLRNSFKSAVADELYKMLAKPFVVQLAATLTGSGGAASGGAAGSASSISNNIGALSGLGKLAGAVGNFFSGGPLFSGLATSLGNFGMATAGAFGNAAISMSSALTAGLSGIGTSITSGFTSLAAGNVASGLGSLGGAALSAAPYIAAAVALYSYFKSKEGGDRVGGSAIYGGGTIYTADHTAHQVDSELSKTVNSLQMNLQGMVASLGGTINGVRIGLGYNTDPKGTAGTDIHGAVKDAAGNDLFFQKNTVGRSNEDLQAGLELESKRVLLAALKASTLPEEFGKVFSAIDIASASKEQIDAAMQAIDGIRAIRDAFVGFSAIFPGLSALSYAAKESLASLSGGLDKLQGNLSSYYQNFYSDAERQANATKQLQDQFTALGLTMPATREEYRKLVETLGLHLDTEEGRKLATSVLALNPAFAALVPATNAAGNGIGSVGASLQQLADDAKATKEKLLSKYAAPQTAAEAYSKIKAGLGSKIEVPDLSVLLTFTPDALKKSIAQLTAGIDDTTPAGQAFLKVLDSLTDSFDTVIAAAGGADDAMKKLADTAQGQKTGLLDKFAPTLTTDKAYGNITDVFASLGIQSAPLADALALGSDKLKSIMSDFVAGIDKTTPSGQALLATLSALGPSFDAVLGAADAASAKSAQIAQSREQMNIQLMQASGDAAGALAAQRKIELAALDASLRPLQEQIYAAQDAAAAENQLKVARETATNQSQSIFEKYATDSQKVAQANIDLIAGFSKLGLAVPKTAADFLALAQSADATTPAGQALLATLYGLTGAFDTVTGAAASAAAHQLETAKAAVAAAFETVKRSVDAERSGITATYNANVASTQTAITGLTAAVGKFKSLSDALKGTLSGLTIAGDTGSVARSVAQSQISAALAIARAGGGLPDESVLKDALAAIAKPSEGLFSDFTDYARDFYRTANDIQSLSTLADGQLTSAEQSLAAAQDQLATLKAIYDGEMARLDGVLAKAQDQVDAINGVDKSVLSVAEAMAALTAAILAQKAAETPVVKPMAKLLAVNETAPYVNPNRNTSSSAQPMTREDAIAVVAAIDALRADNSAENRAIASNTRSTAKQLSELNDGGALSVTVVA